MNQFPPLPAPDAPADPDSEDLVITFVQREWGGCSAVVKNEYGDKVDEIREDSFENAYDTVSRNYPQAKWTPAEEDETDVRAFDSHDIEAKFNARRRGVTPIEVSKKEDTE